MRNNQLVISLSLLVGVATACSVPEDSIWFTASTVNGVAPVEVRFEVSYSNQPGVLTVYDWGSSTRTITVPSGDYSLTVRAVPRDGGYQRIGFDSYQSVPVCTGDALTVGSGNETDAQQNCSSGGGDQLLVAGRVARPHTVPLEAVNRQKD
ncbi:MAG: hypothetical protein H0W15_13580 [Gemmatimonadales bacterium]|nr:hypothetical protein [Gemmatimonadales bacterium]